MCDLRVLFRMREIQCNKLRIVISEMFASVLSSLSHSPDVFFMQCKVIKNVVNSYFTRNIGFIIS